MPLWESEAQQEQEMHLGINPSCSKQTKEKGNKLVMLCAHCKMQVALMLQEDGDMKVEIYDVRRVWKVFQMEGNNE